MALRRAPSPRHANHAVNSAALLQNCSITRTRIYGSEHKYLDYYQQNLAACCVTKKDASLSAKIFGRARHPPRRKPIRYELCATSRSSKDRSSMHGTASMPSNCMRLRPNRLARLIFPGSQGIRRSDWLAISRQ
jgi:hypothetical protein